MSELTPWLFSALLAGAVGVGLYFLVASPTPNAVPRTRSVASTNAVQQTRPAEQGQREAMPVGDIPGWHQVFADNFGGRTIDLSKWRVYTGEPGGDPAGWFDPSHVKLSNGMLVLSGYQDRADGGKWATGGLSTNPGLVQTYGKYLVRLRFDRAVGIAHVLLLVPANGSWPPEIDFGEDNGAWRDTMQATLHYGAADSTFSKRVAVDQTQWHTVGVEWTPGRLVFTLDGRVWYQVTGSAVPAIPMALAIQTQAWPCVGTWGVCPNASTPRVVRTYVDWVVAYKPAGR